MSKSTSLIMGTTIGILGAVFVALYLVPSVPTVAFGIVGALLIGVIGVYAIVSEPHDVSYAENNAYAPVNNPFHRW